MKWYAWTIIALIAAACNELTEGNVVSMHVEPERDYLYMMPIPHTTTCGKTSVTTFTYIPMIMHDDADYVITIRGHNTDNEELVESFYVRREAYNCIKTGDFIKLNEECYRESNKDTRK